MTNLIHSKKLEKHLLLIGEGYNQMCWVVYIQVEHGRTTGGGWGLGGGGGGEVYNQLSMVFKIRT